MLSSKSGLNIPKAHTRAVICPTYEFYAGSLKGRADKPEISWIGLIKSAFRLDALYRSNTNGAVFRKSLDTHWKHQLKRLDGAYTPNTIHSYYADASKFVDWCQERELAPFPLKSENIVTYLEGGQCNTAYVSKRRSLSALRRINSLLGYEDKTRGGRRLPRNPKAKAITAARPKPGHRN